jgi:uncharacterized protein (DUF1501 family)
MPSPLSRRAFLDRSVKLGALTALATLTDVPFVMRRALADGQIGRNGHKLLFIFLRGANDALNSVIPVGDDAYGPGIRPDITIPRDPGLDYAATGPADFPAAGPTAPTYGYPYALRLGNGFNALHPSLKFLVPVYHAGELALIHRVAYPGQSRSHFDSQNYWENGDPNNDLSRDGIFYRAILESGLANTSPLTGVSFQSSLPLILRGSQAAMTNLSDPARYNLFGIPNTVAGNAKADAALRAAMAADFADRKNRDLLRLQYANLSDTLDIFAQLNFSESGNTYVDGGDTDGHRPYHLFPTTAAKNGGGAAAKYVVPANGQYPEFFNRLKAAAIVLNKTDAIIAGTQLDGFDTHSNQGGVTGSHANLQRAVAWAIYALRQYFTRYPDRCDWQRLTVVTLSEFGRTTIQNSDAGTDHAEGGVMFVAGGRVKGHGRHASGAGVLAATPGWTHNGQTIPWVTGMNGSMFGARSRYLKRAVDFRSVLGELVRNHLGATPEQLGRILPGYRDPAELLERGGVSGVDGVRIFGEPGIV